MQVNVKILFLIYSSRLLNFKLKLKVEVNSQAGPIQGSRD